MISIVARPVSLVPRCTQDHSQTASAVDSVTLAAWSNSSVDKSVHHFCILPNGSQLPQPYRAIWRPYHIGLKDETEQVSDNA